MQPASNELFKATVLSAAAAAVLVSGLMGISSENSTAVLAMSTPLTCFSGVEWGPSKDKGFCLPGEKVSNGIQPGDWFNLMNEDQEVGLLDSGANISENAEQFRKLSEQVKNGEMLASGRKIEDGVSRYFAVRELRGMEVVDGQLTVGVLPFLEEQDVQLLASDVALTPSGFNSNNDQEKILKATKLALEHPDVYNRAVQESDQIKQGFSTSHSDLIRAKYSFDYINLINKNIDITTIDQGAVILDIGDYIIEIEGNNELERVVNEIETKSVPALNKLLKATLNPEDFQYKEVPILEATGTKAIWFLKVDSGNDFGGGWSGDLAGEKRSVLYGSYNDSERVNSEEAIRALCSNIAHERYWHTIVQLLSSSAGTSMGSTDESFNNFTHNAMGNVEFVSCWANGIYYPPNDRIMVVATVLMDRGYSAEEAVRLITNVAAHGDKDNAVRQLYDSARGELPSLTELMTEIPETVPDVENNKNSSLYLQALAKMAGLEIPPPEYRRVLPNVVQQGDVPVFVGGVLPERKADLHK